MTAVARSAVRSALLLAIALTVRVIGPARRLLRPLVQPGTRQFLLIRLDLLGDVAFSLSAIRALKESTPDSEITMVTLPQTAGLARLCRDVDHVIEIDTNRIRSPRTLLQGGTVREIVRAVH